MMILKNLVNNEKYRVSVTNIDRHRGERVKGMELHPQAN
jgi:hypothetical protein